MQPQQPKLPQLKMRFNKFDSLPEVKLPEGYSLRTFQAGDEDNWVEVLNATGQLGEWNREKVKGWLEGERRIIEEGTFFITFKWRPVATACTVHPTPSESRPELGWVSASPDHQGKGLGYQVSLAVLHFMKKKGYPETFLQTDDHRLPALKTYLKLGFEPEITHESHPGRWKAVYEKLTT